MFTRGKCTSVCSRIDNIAVGHERAHGVLYTTSFRNIISDYGSKDISFLYKLLVPTDENQKETRE